MSRCRLTWREIGEDGALSEDWHRVVEFPVHHRPVKGHVREHCCGKVWEPYFCTFDMIDYETNMKPEGQG